MKKYLILASIAMMAASCSSSSNKFTIEGKLYETIEGDSIKVVLYGGDINDVIAAGVTDARGNYYLEGEVNEPDMVALILANQIIGQFYIEPGKIRSENVDGKNYFSGTRLNNINRGISQQTRAIADAFDTLENDEFILSRKDSLIAEYYAVVKKAIDKNLDNMVGVNEFLYGEFSSLSSAEALERIAEFSTEMQNSSKLIEAKELAQKRLLCEVGQPYTDICLADINGKEVALSSLVGDGRYILLDFWATWCNPCMNEMPHLKEAYAKYHSKGFEIYGVSLDRSQDSWATYAAKLPWVNVINTSEATATADYSIQSIPSNFLIGPDGTIIATNLRGTEVLEKLAEIL